MTVQVPEWVKHAVFYQIFPDRFARSNRIRLPRGITLKPWGTPPEQQGFQGGNLPGIVDRLDYLQALGVNAIYLNPIFASGSNHRYHTFDYFQVDPLLGGNEALRELLDEAHARGIRIILDGVYNHASRGFWPFHHVLESGSNSPYVDWFFIRDWPLVPYPPDGETPINYDAWWGLPALPKLNVANPGVRDYLMEVTRHWIDFGIDGWRMDVAEEIDDESFWQEFRQVAKRANPDAYLVAEIWHEAKEWLQGDRFDAVMNYVLARAALCFFGAKTLRTEYRPGNYVLTPLRAKEFARTVELMTTMHHWEITQAQLNLLDSHDTARALWIVNGDESALRLCVLFQMTMPGAPCIYYGDEIGMTGATDPYCRAAFPWDDEESWNKPLLEFYRRAIAMRHQHRVLRTGSVQTLYADNGVYACLRQDGDAYAIVIYNTRQSAMQLNLDLCRGDPHPAGEITRVPDGLAFRGVWNGSEFTVNEGRVKGVRAPARDAVVLVSVANS
ncbi:MAG TPA: glycoside hydrolase family 13 protein [Caldilineaceae bacterium]|nr:glycoside hydrolase family 13 protein [Caldilineaceae bacterium]